MSKKRKSQEAKSAHKPIHNLAPDAKHSGEYSDKLNNPDHLKLSDNTSNMNRSGGNLAGPTMWGDPNGQEMGGPL